MTEQKHIYNPLTGKNYPVREKIISGTKVQSLWGIKIKTEQKKKQIKEGIEKILLPATGFGSPYRIVREDEWQEFWEKELRL